MNAGAPEFREDFDLYERTAREYDSIRFAGRAGTWSDERQMGVLFEALPDMRGKRVLEIGAGTGRVTAKLAAAGARVTATDISAEMLEVAKRRIAALRPRPDVEFRRLNIFDRGLDVADYDVIVALNVLSRLSDARGALRNIAETISPRAQLVFSFNCSTSVLLPFAMLVNARGKSLSRNVTSRWYAPREIETYCDAAGLTITRWLGNHYVPVPKLLFFTLPLFQACDRLLSRRFARLSPSVFAVTRLSDATAALRPSSQVARRSAAESAL
jgi:2-polyprenyl-3-methyl-5-hydroxy-6-metoxy-1,4-benzoquinol methylase